MSLRHPAGWAPAHVLARTLVGVLCLGAAAAAQEGRATAPAAPLRDISGFWELTVDGRRVPAAVLLPTVSPDTVAQQAQKDAHAIRWCNFLGMPTVMDGGRPLDIRQGVREIVIQPEVNATPRHLYLSRTEHIPTEEFDPTTNGDSIARWDGDTLVVTTINIAADKGITAIPGGGFRTAATRLTERYRLLKAGAVLSVTFTWEDPTVFARPHSYEFRYQRLPPTYEPRPRLACDPFDQERATFLTAP